MQISKSKLVKVFTKIQDEGDIHSNSIATKAIKDFGLSRHHAKLQKKKHDHFLKHLFD